jgi:ABC-type Fe3+/spermidine/putrescine transport system ATPase subunit
VLLLDEPLSALDKSLRVEMQIELKRIQREVGITTIFVTHDQEEALTLSDRIGILRDGRLIRHGTPHEVYDDPGDAFTARFLGEANLMEVRSTDGALLLLDGTAIRPPQGTPTDTIALRPEMLTITPEEPASGNRLRGTMGQRVFAGAMASCTVALNGQSLKVMARSRDLRALPEQGEVWLSWNPEDARWIRP